MNLLTNIEGMKRGNEVTPESIADLLIYGLPLVTAGSVYALTAASLFLTVRYRNSRLAQALVILDEAVISVVKELNQTVVDDLKKARADGKLTPDEAKQIKSKAVELVLTRLGSKVPRLLQKRFGSLFNLVGTKVEATVYDLKRPVSLAQPGQAPGRQRVRAAG